MKPSTPSPSIHPDALSILLLLVVGSLLAAMLPLSKQAMSLGMTPLAYGFWQALGGGLILIAWQSGPLGWKAAHSRYFVFSGLTSIAIPNVLAYVVVSQIGSGLTATLYALPSLITYAISLTLSMERAAPARTLGLILGVAGCLWILSPSPAGIGASALPWLLIGLLIPLSLALGNIYRTTHWPAGATPEQLAPGMLLVGAALILGVIVATGRSPELLVTQPAAVGIVLVQSALTAVAYRGFFLLQQRTSPTFVSQLGFVITPVGLVFGVLFFGERIGWSVWLGVAVLLAGMVIANRRERQPQTVNAGQAG